MQYTTLSEITPEPLKNVCLSMKSEDCFSANKAKQTPETQNVYGAEATAPP